MRKIKEIIVHCSASDRIVDDSVEAITKLHTTKADKVYGDWGSYENVKGVGCKKYAGYHIIITKKKINFVRPIEKAGAHCRGRNSSSIGICITGDVYFSEEQRNWLKESLHFLKMVFELSNDDIKPHSFHNKNKTCPNIDLDKLLKELDD